jgi:hypothetical protein
VVLDKAPVSGDEVRPDLAEALDVPTPVPLQLAGNGDPGDELHTGLLHTPMGSVPGDLVESSRCVRDGVDIVALLDQAEGGERNAHLGQDAAGDH